MPASSLCELLQTDAYWNPVQGLNQQPAHGADERLDAAVKAVGVRAQEGTLEIVNYTEDEGRVPLPGKDQVLYVVFDVRQDQYSYLPDPRPATPEKMAAFDAEATRLENDWASGLDEQGVYAWIPRAGRPLHRRIGRQPALLVASSIGRLIGSRGLRFGRPRAEGGASSIKRVTIGTTYSSHASGFLTLARPSSARLLRLSQE